MLRNVMNRYLVTGCAGFIGSHLTETLLQRGHEVVGVDSFTDFYSRSAKEANLAEAKRHKRFMLVEADLAETAVEPLLDGVVGVFHLAAQPGVRGSWGASYRVYLRDNVLATQRLLEAAVRAGARLVLASSSSIYGNAESYPTHEDARPFPISPYGVTKLSCEHLVATYAASADLDSVVLRYFTVYGPRQRPDMAFARIVAAFAGGMPFLVFGSGEQSRDFTYVSDAVEATIAAMERGSTGGLYNVSGGGEASIRDVISECERLTERALDVGYEAEAAGDVVRTAGETSRIRREFGWAPKVDLVDGLAAQLAWGGALSDAFATRSGRAY